MRKALGIACLGIALLAGLACSQDSASSTPTAPEIASTPAMQNTFAAVQVAKVLICHFNTSEPQGVVVEVTGQTTKRHSKHVDDCFINSCWGVESGEVCDNDGGEIDYCGACV